MESAALTVWIITFLRYVLFAGIPFLIFYILFPKAFFRHKIQSKDAQRQDFLREIWHSVQTTVVLAGIGVIVLKTPLSAYTQVYYQLDERALWWVPVSTVLALVLHDTYFYWLHRTIHHPKLFRSIHRVHHQSINPSPWASYSFHLTEAALEGMIAPLILFLIPMHPLGLLLFVFTGFAFNVYGHLGYELAPKWFRQSFLFDLLNTSTHHNLHHSKFNGNYGLYFRIWDRIMGTEHPDYVATYDAIQEQRFGSSATVTTAKLKG